MDDDITFPRVVKWVTLGLILFTGVVWAVQGTDFFLYQAFAPKYEEVRRETRAQSQAYVDGKVTQLSRVRRDYAATTERVQKCALRGMALHEATTVDVDVLPTDLATWINELEEDTTCR